jgi:ABC-2 type transport system ATP-binding protein
MSPPLALEVSQLSKTFLAGRSDAVRALDDVALNVASGEVVALLGNNGAGKTTLMSICAGLLAPDSGCVTVLGHSVTGTGRPSLDLGLAPQDEAIYPTVSVRRNLEYFGQLAGLRGQALEDRVASVSRSLLVHSLLDKRAGKLSGGQRRRLHTGLALMHNPSVLVLDEPTVGVDIESRGEILNFVRTSAERGKAVLYSTHQLHEVAELNARVVVISHGRTIASGTVDELVANHAPPTAELQFSHPSPTLSASLVELVDEMTQLGDHRCRVVLRIEEGTDHVGDLVDLLDSDSRSLVTSAVIRPPSLEQAYLRLVGGGNE